MYLVHRLILFEVVPESQAMSFRFEIALLRSAIWVVL